MWELEQGLYANGDSIERIYVQGGVLVDDPSDFGALTEVVEFGLTESR